MKATKLFFAQSGWTLSWENQSNQTSGTLAGKVSREVPFKNSSANFHFRRGEMNLAISTLRFHLFTHPNIPLRNGNHKINEICKKRAVAPMSTGRWWKPLMWSVFWATQRKPSLNRLKRKISLKKSQSISQNNICRSLQLHKHGGRHLETCFNLRYGEFPFGTMTNYHII